MKTASRVTRALVLSLVFALLAAACAGGDPEEAGGQDSPAPAEEGAGATAAPQAAEFAWGTFELDDRIASKLESGEALNIVLSFQTLGDVLAPALLTAGMERAADELSEQHGVDINVRLIGPVETDPPAQIAEVQTVVNAGQVDCLGVQPVSPDAFVDIIDEGVDAGIPTFTVNTDSPDSKRFAYFGLSEVAAGETAGRFTAEWASENGFEITNAALTTGDTTASWAQDRMTGWVNIISEEFPDAEIVGTPTDAFTTTYDPGEVFSRMQAFLGGHPDVDFIFHTDWGAKTIGPLVTEMDKKGEVGVIGFNVDGDYLDAVANGDIIGTVDQGFDNQSEAFVHGCIDYLLEGSAPSDPLQFVDPVVISQDNLAEQREKFESVVGS